MKIMKLKIILIIYFVITSVFYNSALKNQNFIIEKTIFNEIIFPSTPEEIKNNINNAIIIADRELDKIANEKNNTFENTIAAFDKIFYEANKIIGPSIFLINVSQDKKIRSAAQEARQKYFEWSAKVFFREDLYETVLRFKESNPVLSGEDKILYENILNIFNKNGFGLPAEKRKELEKLNIKLEKLCSNFLDNIKNHKNIVKFTKNELKGVPETALTRLDQDENSYYLMDARIASQYAVIAQYAENEKTRLKANIAFFSVAKDKNKKIIKEILTLRTKIAKLLGYNSYAEYKIEDKMAKTPETVINFLNSIVQGVSVKFKEELKIFRDLKINETKDKNAVLNQWDILYYERLLLEQKYNLNMEEIKNYFAMENCLKGMFNIFEEIFNIKIIKEKIKKNNTWHKDVFFYHVYDTKNNKPLGSFYLDLYPREGKYNHFANFKIIGNKVISNSIMERPVCAIVCNFPKPNDTTPSLLSIFELKTLFHEFGHAMHEILSKTKYSWLHGTSVPEDFLEVPSQILEQWITDKSVLDKFAFDYRDNSKKIPDDFLIKMENAKKAVLGKNIIVQITYGMIDMILHTQNNSMKNIIEETNNIINKYYMPFNEHTSLITCFPHIGTYKYSACYYVYIWAESIVYDIASVFKKSKKGFLDKKLGMKLRKEIYEPGGSRDVNESIKSFLGRDWNTDAFFYYLGLKQ